MKSKIEAWRPDAVSRPCCNRVINCYLSTNNANVSEFASLSSRECFVCRAPGGASLLSQCRLSQDAYSVWCPGESASVTAGLSCRPRVYLSMPPAERHKCLLL